MNLPRLLVLLGCGLPGQDVLFYKFDEVGGPDTVNFASSSQAGPAAGKVKTTDTSGFAPGRFGLGALRGFTSGTAYSWVDTGWSPSFSGSFTVACWIRQRPASSPGINPSYLFSCSNGTGLFRMFTGGIAGKGLVCRGFESGGYGTDLIETSDIVSGAIASWEHVALVVDSVALSARFFVAGVPKTQRVLLNGAALANGVAPFRVGAFSTPSSYAGYYDIDEFRFALHAASDLEIAAWANRSMAAEAAYGSGCRGSALAGTGMPSIGNKGYGFKISGQPSGVFALALGSSRTLMQGTYPLPVDLVIMNASLSGCFWQSSAEFWLGGVLSTGQGSLGLPVPNDLALDGVVLFAQAWTNGMAGVQVTNGLAVAIGQ